MNIILPNQERGVPKEIARWLREEKNVKLANRLNAIRLLMIGKKHSEVSEICGVTTRCITKWVHKWNSAGREGLKSNSGGSRSRVTPEMRVDICKEVKIKTSRGEIVTGKLICGYLKKTTE